MINRSILCRTANTLTRSMTRSQAFITAWKMLKGKLVEKVAGVSHEDRQRAIEHLARYAPDSITIRLEREPENLFDRNAIAVVATVTGKGSVLMGYVPAHTVAWLAPVMDKGITVKTILRDIVGGMAGYSYGLRVGAMIA